MRVTVTVTEDMNKYYTDIAKLQGISRDKAMSTVLAQHMEHNPRGAGRKQRFRDTEKVAMRYYKSQGMSYREIAKIYDCSAGLVYKLINEQ